MNASLKVMERAVDRVAGAVIADWLLTEGRRHGDVQAFTDALARRLADAGVGLWRLSFGLPVLHPLIRFITVYWWNDKDAVELIPRPHGSEHAPAYLTSPVAVILEERAEGLRFRLDQIPDPPPHPILGELRDEGARDYAIMALVFSDGAQGERRGTISIATRDAGGFTTDALALIDGLRPALSLVLESLMMRHLTRTLLETYVGRRTGARVMSGEIRRGSLESLRAVIWYCDLRGFTALSDRLAPPDLIALLNGYFEIMGGAVEEQGGEVLKFIGDAMLAVFPLPDITECAQAEAEVAARALDAARAAIEGMDRRNTERAAWGEPVLRCGIGLHLGDVLYGNIGAPSRLDFTVIGRGVNLVTRIEGLCKRLERQILATPDFARALAPRGDVGVRSLGWHPLRGLRDPVEVFGFDEMAAGGA